jgi:glycosyltransferase involved in cell wall biosynthesis
MRVLWFTPTPSLYNNDTHDYHGGGWVSSMERIITLRKEIELGISFYHKTDNKKVLKNNTTYYPIKIKRKRNNPIRGLFNTWSGNIDHNNLEEKYLEIISNFRPDVIHIFGTENAYTVINQITSIPVVIQTQGLINPIVNAYYPVNQSKWSFLIGFNFLVNSIFASSPNFAFKKYRNIAKQEKVCLSNTKYVIGRTHWDKMLAKLYNCNVGYFHLDEVLRPNFYDTKGVVENKDSNMFHIISTLSPNIYKGIDVVLKTANQLKQLSDIDFQWHIIGLEENDKYLNHFEKTENIDYKKAGIICYGKKNPEELIDLLQKADVYVHPSYIDNSPNSLCEAQILGLPVIACNVGGISSLIEHNVSGFLVPSNGVFELVHYLILLNQDTVLAAKIGQEGKLVAEARHNQRKIVADILNIYSEIRN